MDADPFIIEIRNAVGDELATRLDAALSVEDANRIATAIAQAAYDGVVRGYVEAASEINERWRAEMKRATGKELELHIEPNIDRADFWADLDRDQADE